MKIEAAIEKKLKIIKKCGWKATGCFQVPINSLNDPVQLAPDGVGNYMSVITADGFSYAFYSLNSNCSTSAQKLCMTLFFDVNGLKPPNTAGRDIFLLYLKNNGFFWTHGGDNTWQTSSGDKGSNCRTDFASFGFGCSSRIIDEGWVMNY